MKPEHLEKLIEWYREELEDFKAQSIDGETIKEPAFAKVVLESMVQRHFPEIRADPDLLEATLQAASPKVFFPQNTS